MVHPSTSNNLPSPPLSFLPRLLERLPDVHWRSREGKPPPAEIQLADCLVRLRSSESELGEGFPPMSLGPPAPPFSSVSTLAALLRRKRSVQVFLQPEGHSAADQPAVVTALPSLKKRGGLGLSSCPVFVSREFQALVALSGDLPSQIYLLIAVCPWFCFFFFCATKDGPG